MNKKWKLKAICIILVLIWMIVVFLLSNEVAQDSTQTSGNVIRWLITLLNNNLTESELQLKIDILQPIIRKLAHFTLYAVGGVLIYIMFLQFKEGIKLTKLTSILLGIMYAVTDEIHQLYVPGRSGEVRDVIIDSAGVVLGVFVICFVLYSINRWDFLKRGNNE